MTEVRGGSAGELALIVLDRLKQNEFAGARDALAALIEKLPPDSPLAPELIQLYNAFTLSLTKGLLPTPELLASLRALLHNLSAQLPPGTQSLSETSHREHAKSGWKKLGPIGAVLAFLAKFKTVGLLLATKGKMLLLGLANFKSLISIAGFLGIYWAMFGWWFALGIVASIFIHEMGHIVKVRRYGFAVSAPLFLPGFGAFVRWQGTNVTTLMLSRIALAGPLFGLFAAIGAYFIFVATGSPVWLAVAHTGAWINLFNLIPISLLDGGSAFFAIGRQERLAVLIVSAALWFMLGQAVFLFIALGALFRLWRNDVATDANQSVAYYFIGLVIALGLVDWWFSTQAGMRFPQNHLGAVASL